MIINVCRTTKRQTNYLDKYRVFAQNAGQLDHDQEKLREECLRYWKVPDITKKKPYEMHESLNTAISRLVKQVCMVLRIDRRSIFCNADERGRIAGLVPCNKISKGKISNRDVCF